MKKLLVVVLIATLAGASEPASRAWKISTLQAPVLTRDTHPLFTVASDRLILADKKHKSLLEIPAEQIDHIVYTTVPFSRAYQVAGDKSGKSGLWQPLNAPGCAGGEAGCGGMVMLYLLTLAIAAPMHGRSHFFRITWHDRNVEQQLQFEADKADYAAINESLKSLAGPDKFTDIEAEQKQLEIEIAHNAHNAVTVKLDRPSVLNGYHLLPGVYSLLALDRGEGEADLYVFSTEDVPKIEMSKVKASARVTVRETADPDTVEYVSGTPTITSISAGGKLFQVSSFQRQ